MKHFIKNRNFYLFLFGANTSVFGDVLLTTALALHIMNITQSPKAFGGIMALTFVPRLVMNIFSGALVDKLNSKKVMITLDLLRGFVLFCISGIDEIGINVVVPLVLLFAVVDTFFLPASITIVPKLFSKDKISKVNSIDQSLRSTLNMVSPLVASFLYITGGLKFILIIDGITFILSALSEYLLTFDDKKSNSSKANLLENIKDGIKVVFSDVRVASLLINGALTHLFLFTFVEVGMISLLLVTFKRAEFHYGILQGIISFATILASSLAIFYRNKKSIGEQINIGIIGMILAVVLFIPLSFRNYIDWLGNNEFYPVIYLSVCCFFLFLSFGYYVVFFRSFYQSEVPKEYLGRFSSIFMVLVSLSRILGAYIYGILFEKQIIIYPVLLLAFGMIIKLIVHIPFLKHDNKNDDQILVSKQKEI